MTIETTYQFPGNFCPHCNMKLDAATNIESGRAPTPEDMTICIYCYSWLVFKDDMTLRPASQVDIDKLPEEFVNRLLLATKALENFNRLHEKP